MSVPVYTKTPKKLSTFLEKIRSLGIPNNADDDWLIRIGYDKASDRSLLVVLKYVGFVDQGGAPTKLWSDFRTNNGPKALGISIREAYKKLFETYPNAQNLSDGEITAFYAGDYKGGTQGLSAISSTFKTLCAKADFAIEKKEEICDQDITEQIKKTNTSRNQPDSSKDKNLTINFNIQINLPNTDKSDIYDKIFKSMKQYLLTD